MTKKELTLSALWERTAVLEEKLYYKDLELEGLQQEIEASNRKCARFESICIDLSHQAKQLAKYAQTLRPEVQGGTI